MGGVESKKNSTHIPLDKRSEAINRLKAFPMDHLVSNSPKVVDGASKC